MSFLVVANFKSHKTSGEVESWIQAVAPDAAKAKNLEIVVSPSFPHLSLLSSLSSHLDSIQLAAQDVSPFPPGSYTGAVNAKQLQDLGVKYAIVGHSERRRYFHESVGDVANKVKELLDANITPIVCLSEPDILPQRAALADEHVAGCIFCFEPPSLIGGTETAGPEDIKRVTTLIKQKYNTDRVMYGGAVNEDNIDSLHSLDLFGVLVSSGSLESSHFVNLIEKLNHAE